MHRAETYNRQTKHLGIFALQYNSEYMDAYVKQSYAYMACFQFYEQNYNGKMLLYQATQVLQLLIKAINVA